MSALTLLRQDYLDSNKALLEAKSSGFKNLKSSFKQLTIQIDELKSENSKIRKYIEDFAAKIIVFESEPSSQFTSITSQLPFDRN